MSALNCGDFTEIKIEIHSKWNHNILLTSFIIFLQVPLSVNKKKKTGRIFPKIDVCCNLAVPVAVPIWRQFSVKNMLSFFCRHFVPAKSPILSNKNWFIFAICFLCVHPYCPTLWLGLTYAHYTYFKVHAACDPWINRCNAMQTSGSQFYTHQLQLNLLIFGLFDNNPSSYCGSGCVYHHKRGLTTNTSWVKLLNYVTGEQNNDSPLCITLWRHWNTFPTIDGHSLLQWMFCMCVCVNACAYLGMRASGTVTLSPCFLKQHICCKNTHILKKPLSVPNNCLFRLFHP